MLFGLRLYPEQASSIARQTDLLFLFLLAVSAFFIALIFLLVTVFAIKYRRKTADEKPRAIPGSLPLELLWTVIPLGLAMIMFGWGAWLYFTLNRPPADAMEVFVVAKQWMWKFQHSNGMREIDELHVPVGRPVKLTMTSEDVIHSFAVSDFRIKKDVVPGRYTTVWFEATRPGEYRLACAVYCGTEHATMVGRVVVMKPEEFGAWLRGGATGISLTAAGEKLFQQHGCAGCHLPTGTGPGPTLVGLFGTQVKLATGGTVTADEAYIRESILDPQAKIVAGYAPIMPVFKGLINEDGLVQIIAYIKSLGTEQKAKATP